MSGSSAEPYGAVHDAIVLIRAGAIEWVGPRDAAPEGSVREAAEALDLKGGWVTPGLIDSHTHLVFGGDRAAEWERRLGGATYEEIARQGGGILSTVRETRAATTEALQASARRRLDGMIDHGVTSVEIKSGYGLDVETELRMLDVARSLHDAGVSISTTLLGAHALPGEYADDRDGYIDLVCGEMIPAAADAGLADAVDAFCEGIGFSPEECARVLRSGAEHGLAGRLHADQLSDLDGAALAASLGARSADHLEYASESGAAAMGAAGCAAVLLPAAFYFLGETRTPPIEAFRSHGVPMVVATDANPGSAPVANPLVALNLACVLFGLTPEESLAGMTRKAAPVIGAEDRGVIEPGKRADLACWAIGHPAELSYWIGGSPAAAVIADGRRIR